jgi:hypothetical protein
MAFPIQITYRGMDSSETLDRLIRNEAEKLGKFFDRILRCRALVERQPGHHYAASPFHVRLTLAVPGSELVVGSEPHSADGELEALHKDPELTVREAFRRARRRVQEYARRHMGAHTR